jgi:hypothetical protein
MGVKSSLFHLPRALRESCRRLKLCQTRLRGVSVDYTLGSSFYDEPSVAFSCNVLVFP